MKNNLKDYVKHPFDIGNNKVAVSPYMAGIREARSTSGRNIESGVIMDVSRIGCWSSALVYMTIIDHMGKYFSLKNAKATKARNAFVRALETFANLSNKEAFALYALRCSFAHEFSLVNIPKNNDKDRDLLLHRFVVTIGGSKLIDFPKKIWNGDIKEDEQKTIVDLGILGDIVEQMHKNILKNIDKNEIEFLNEMVFLTIPK